MRKIIITGLVIAALSHVPKLRSACGDADSFGEGKAVYVFVKEGVWTQYASVLAYSEREARELLDREVYGSSVGGDDFELRRAVSITSWPRSFISKNEWKRVGRRFAQASARIRLS